MIKKYTRAHIAIVDVKQTAIAVLKRNYYVEIQDSERWLVPKEEGDREDEGLKCRDVGERGYRTFHNRK